MKPSNIVLWCFPLVVIAAQLLPTTYAFGMGIAFTAFGLSKRFRVLLLFGLTIFGYLFWYFTAQYLAVSIHNAPLLIVLNRLGLIGYIILFAIWAWVQPCVGYLRFGSMKETLKAPFTWWGNQERVWRFVLIVCACWMIPTIVFAFLNGNILTFMPYALLFSIMNPILEGVLWRGFILGRIVTYIGEKQGLILSSIAFGVYHLSLGFPIWVCLLFAMGGFFMGGVAIKSKGLFAPIVMHVSANMAMVSLGIIF